VYGANTKVPFSEDDPVDKPVSPYAATKKCGELLAYTYNHIFGLPVTCLRFFTVYGPRQRPEMAIHKFARSILDGKSIQRFGDGNSARDYTFIDDIVAGILAACDRCNGYNIYNLGNSETVTLASLIQKLGIVLGKSPLVEVREEQAGDVPITYADITRAKRDLGYQPKTNIDDGLEAFARWLRGG
jgi:UDP-glucuronate 4-epimerase